MQIEDRTKPVRRENYLVVLEHRDDLPDKSVRGNQAARRKLLNAGWCEDEFDEMERNIKAS
ncbi:MULTISPECIES: hypothetical protein [Enterobacteriaceae]|uniref:hypothetical protein n=1 Tax=Enterobacteriaceae TaxID=543 RepID=UPI001CC1D21A|nr:MULTISPECIES: hypothetical protein [Enterobacteriaceae]MCD9787266.1 hypothetical protein [Klebsiella pneumoniae]MCE0316603.1 hypothetical protein [Klebsiella pneumoniae]MDD1918589.1 hypothetical protein [Klebsiella pneumoniae]MDD1930006.1 hypothetical protein [Klebsiella pneumoniae]MDN0132557.1 hypothetical protein [Klebsiella pneumoniae]